MLVQIQRARLARASRGCSEHAPVLHGHDSPPGVEADTGKAAILSLREAAGLSCLSG
jgi:hypothetical protein